MTSQSNVFILIYFTIILQLKLIATSPVPANRIFQRSIRGPSIISASPNFNYLEEWAKSGYPTNPVRDVHNTIEEVQKILETDPSLPRLTRGEIEDLFEKVTREEYDRSLKTGDLSRAKHMRALMLVLPYNANQTSENDLQELYNRPPITKVISNDPKEEKNQKIVVPSGKVEIVNVKKQIPTTYKPSFRLKPIKTYEDPTTYRPTSTLDVVTKRPVMAKKHYSSTTIPTTPASYESFFEPFIPKHVMHNPAQFKPLPMPSNSHPVDPELEDILMNLGFSAKSQSKKRFKLDEPPPEELSKRMLSSVIKQDPPSSQFYPMLPSAPNLSADDFHKGLGASMSSRDFDSFKPIPEVTGDVPSDLESYLKQFGLYPPFENRDEKQMKEATPQISDRIDTGTFELQDDIQSPEQIKEINALNAPSPTKNTFKPTNPDEEDYRKLQELLHTLRELQQLNASLTEETLAKLDPRHFNLSQTLLSQGPNPIVETEVDLTKNEIKRQTDSPEPIKVSLDLNVDETQSQQEINSATTTPSSLQNDSKALIDEIFAINPDSNFTFPATTLEPSEDATTTTTTTEETPRNNLADLGDSFAGGLGTTDNAEPLPPPRRNGLYFLKDYHAFLEVGEEPDKIVVRHDVFSGDPSRFIPVKVP